MRIINVPGDGNCLFYSCGYLLHINHTDLRKVIGHIIKYHSYLKINDTSISQWIETSEPYYGHEYPISQNYTWGSELELAIISKLCKCQIIVHTSNDLDDIISTYGSNFTKTIHLAFGNMHYNPIIL